MLKSVFFIDFKGGLILGLDLGVGSLKINVEV